MALRYVAGFCEAVESQVERAVMSSLVARRDFDFQKGVRLLRLKNDDVSISLLQKSRCLKKSLNSLHYLFNGTISSHQSEFIS